MNAAAVERFKMIAEKCEYVCAVEPMFPDLVIEMQDLWQEQYEELCEHGDVIPLKPDYVRLKKLEKEGYTRWITCRDRNGVLVGYFFWIIMPHLHYRETLTAQADVYFVTKPARSKGAGCKLFDYAINVCRELGVVRIIIGCKIQHDHGSMIEAFGLKHFENFYDLIL